MTAAADALVAFAAAVSRIPGPGFTGEPPPGADVVIYSRAALLVVTPPVGVLATAFDVLGTPTEGAPLPATSGPLVPLLYPSGPPGVVVAYRGPAGLVAAVVVRWPARGYVGLRLDTRLGLLEVLRRTVGPGTTRFVADALGGEWVDMRTGWAHLRLRDELPDGGRWDVTLMFDGPRLARLSLVHTAPGEAAGWESWSREREEAARERHDAWLAHQLLRTRRDTLAGVGMSDGALDPAGGRGRLFTLPWGRIWSGYDERSAFSSIEVVYDA